MQRVHALYPLARAYCGVLILEHKYCLRPLALRYRSQRHLALLCCDDTRAAKDLSASLWRPPVVRAAGWAEAVRARGIWRLGDTGACGVREVKAPTLCLGPARGAFELLLGVAIVDCVKLTDSQAYSQEMWADLRMRAFKVWGPRRPQSVATPSLAAAPSHPPHRTPPCPGPRIAHVIL